ncbi:MAG: excinuclease ABC subunit UvrA [Bradymonadales bacterium]|jgi:excinuclease ABC subunit A
MDIIQIQDAHEHNLKHIHLDIPKYSLVVMTGPSGSGKSSLAFETLYMEGRRRFFDSLSIYARQFAGTLKKAAVKRIDGLTPSIAVDQGTAATNPRSTVGTITEIYDYMRLLWGRGGTPFCPKCEVQISESSSASIVDRLMGLPEGSRCVLFAPLVRQRKGQFDALLERMRLGGFTRVRIDGEVVELSPGQSLAKTVRHDIDLVIDRVVIKDAARGRISDSVEAALKWGEGQCLVELLGEEPKTMHFSDKAACPICGDAVEELSPNSLAFNSPAGMCPDCEGLGTWEHPELALILNDENMSVLPKDLSESVFIPISQNPEKENFVNIKRMRACLESMGKNGDCTWESLSKSEKDCLLFGSPKGMEIKRKSGGQILKEKVQFPGFMAELQKAYENTTKSALRQYLSAFMVHEPCKSCKGTRLKPSSQSVRFAGKTIAEIHALTVKEAFEFFSSIKLNRFESLIAKDALPPLLQRLAFVQRVGLGYLQLSRSGPTLSGGESQRVRLAALLGSGLTGVTYILDEPSIGLHARDQARLIGVLQDLRDRENTVVVVEHDEATMRAADWIVDFGPKAGKRGGEIVYSGTLANIEAASMSLTADYLLGRKRISLPSERRKAKQHIEILAAKRNNLKSVDLKIPLANLVLITGVSGSGKSTLINDILVPALKRNLAKLPPLPIHYSSIHGLDAIQRVIEVDQKPIGRTPRSNPATYTKVFDLIRLFYSILPESKIYGYGPGRFSFNVSGQNAGRCEQCQGAGVRTIEMRFLSNTYVPCEACAGKRFNDATLRARYKDHSIADILSLSFNDALILFEDHPKIARILQTVIDVGLGYLTLGQPSPTLSGGEAQRIKLSREISRSDSLKTLYILDEPTTGLHFDDIRLLLSVLQNLVDRGHSVVIIEHNLDLIKCADYIIELGPEGGYEGGQVVAQGTPEQIATCEKSYTGQYLRKLL